MSVSLEAKQWASDYPEFLNDRDRKAYDVARQFHPELTEFQELGLDDKGNIYFAKDETDNPTGAYKWRGAGIKMNSLVEHGFSGKVVTASAGNHGQGVAWTAGALGIAAEVFVPVGTPGKKLEGLSNLGANVHVGGDNFDEATSLAQQFALSEARRKKITVPFIHPFNDMEVMDGQGTIAAELVLQMGQNVNYEDTTVFVPVGGGGLIAGFARQLKKLSNGQIKVVGVQVEGSDSAALTFKSTLGCQETDLNGAIRYHSAKRKLSFAYIFEDATKPNQNVDGTCVKQVGNNCLPSIFNSVDEFLVVSNELIGEYYVHNPGSRLEPAGVLADVGANYYGKLPTTTMQNLIALRTGRNQDPQRVQNLKDIYHNSEYRR